MSTGAYLYIPITRLTFWMGKSKLGEMKAMKACIYQGDSRTHLIPVLWWCAKNIDRAVRRIDLWSWKAAYVAAAGVDPQKMAAAEVCSKFLANCVDD